MNQNKKMEDVVELLDVDYEEMDLPITAMTMQEIVDAAIERGFRPQNKSNCFYHLNYSDEMAAYRFLQSYEQ